MPTQDTLAEQLITAARSGQVETLARLMETYPQMDSEAAVSANHTALFLAVDNNHPQCVRLLLSGPHGSLQGQHSNWAIATIAASKGFEEVLGLLLDSVGPRIPLRSAALPLDLCVANGHAGCAQQLLSRVSANAFKTVPHSSPLFLAAAHGHAHCIPLLLNYYDANQRNAQGQTALMVAAQWKKLDCVRALLGRSDANARCSQGQQNALMQMLDFCEHFDESAFLIAQALLPHTDLECQDAQGATVVDMAINRGAWAIADLLCESRPLDETRVLLQDAPRALTPRHLARMELEAMKSALLSPRSPPQPSISIAQESRPSDRSPRSIREPHPRGPSPRQPPVPPAHNDGHDARHNAGRDDPPEAVATLNRPGRRL